MDQGPVPSQPENPAQSVSTVVVVAGGEAPTSVELGCLPTNAAVVAVDAGLDYCLAAGLEVTAVVGDMDSVSPESIAVAERAGIHIERHPEHKDQTDLELALEMALRLSETPSLDGHPANMISGNKIIVLGAGGGRLDHLLGNLAVLASPRWCGAEVEAWLGDARVAVVRGWRVLQLGVGDSVSLFAVGSPARVSSSGLVWDLQDEVLVPFTSRGVSNKSTVDGPRLAVCEGVVLAVLSAETKSKL